MTKVDQAIENENATKAAQNFITVVNCTIAVILSRFDDVTPKRADVKKIVKEVVPEFVRYFPFRKIPGKEKAIVYKTVLKKITTQEDLAVGFRFSDYPGGNPGGFLKNDKS